MSEPVKNTQDLRETILNTLDPDSPYCATNLIVEDLTELDDPNALPELHFRLTVAIWPDTNETDLMTLAYDLATEALSNQTNNDACDVTVRIRSAHFDRHADLPETTPESLGRLVYIDAIILDSLT